MKLEVNNRRKSGIHKYVETTQHTLKKENSTSRKKSQDNRKYFEMNENKNPTY